jgi:hypothetical protein
VDGGALDVSAGDGGIGIFEVDAPQKGENSFEIKTTNGSVRMSARSLRMMSGVVYDSPASMARSPDLSRRS